MSEVKQLFEGLNKAFEDFKVANDERLKQIEQNGKADPLLEEKVDKANSNVTAMETKLSEAQKEIQNRVDELDLSMQRQGLGANGKPTDGDLKAETKEFFSMVNGRQVQDSEVDVDAYSAYKQAFGQYLRQGNKALNNADIRNALSVGSDPDGGQWVPASTSNRIITKIFETSPMRQIANTVTIGTDRLEIPKDLEEGVVGGWVGETESRAATDTPQVGLQEIPVHEQYAMPQATQKLLDDTMFDVEGWLSNKISDRLVRAENTAFVSGDGIMKPRGFTDYPTAATADSTRAWGTFEHILSGSSGAIPDTPEEFITLVHKLKAAYRTGANWVMNKNTLASIRKLAGGTNDLYYFIPDMSQGPKSLVLGYPVVEFEDMEDAGGGKLCMAFGNFNVGYQIVDRIGIRVLRDPFTLKPYIRYYTTKRVGGASTGFEAVKFIKCNA